MGKKNRKDPIPKPGYRGKHRHHTGKGRGRKRVFKKEEDEEKLIACLDDDEIQSDEEQAEAEDGGDLSSSEEPRSKQLKMEETFELTEEQKRLIQNDSANTRLWDEAMEHLKEGPKFLCKLEQSFMCLCCQELAFQPITTVCSHNVCKACLQRSFRAQVYTCPACRHDLGKEFHMTQNRTLQTLLDQFFPGYSKGR